MGQLTSKLRLEDKNQYRWRLVAKRKLPKADIVENFEELYFLRGGKSKISVCPSLFWEDSYSLVDHSQALGNYFRQLITCDSMYIWNFSNKELHSSRKENPDKEKSKGTNYSEVLPKLLRTLTLQQMEPKIIHFQECDFSYVPQQLLKEFFYTQVGKLEDIEFCGCSNLPFPDHMFIDNKHLEDDIKAIRKMSVLTVHSFNLDSATTSDIEDHADQ